MYMNCAAVTVANGGSGLTGPTPFVANANVNECHTIENTDVVFPYPGSIIHYGGSYASSKPTAPAGFTGSNCVGPGATASYPTSSKASSSVSPSSASSVVQTSATATSSLYVHEKVVSTVDAPSSTEIASSDVMKSTNIPSSTGTASASAVTSTSTSTNGKVSLRG